MMGMTIDEAVLELNWLKKVNQEILETDAKEIDADSAWIKHWESVTQALDIAIDTARKYQMMQADYNARLKDDMVAMLEDLKQDLIAEANGIAMDCTVFVVKVADIDKVIQQKINELKGENENE